MNAAEILRKVLAAMQPAEEKDGPEGEEYAGLMLEIANESTRRAHLKLGQLVREVRALPTHYVARSQSGPPGTACARCGAEVHATIMSMFNTDMICLDCKDLERQRPDYAEAAKAEDAAVRAGNWNFPGIGLKK